MESNIVEYRRIREKETLEEAVILLDV